MPGGDTDTRYPWTAPVAERPAPTRDRVVSAAIAPADRGIAAALPAAD